MKKKLLSISALAVAGMLLTTPVYANAGDGHGHDDDHGSKTGHHDNDKSDDDHHGNKKGDMYSASKEVNGYTVNFMIMPAKPGKEMGGSHDVMVKVAQNGEPVKDVTMKTKVVHPNGKSQTKSAMAMGDWLMAGYDLGHNGKHKLMVLFKTKDGKKHKTGISYAM